jgi:hypothetical protein
MKKNELVHYHALLVRVARDLVDRGVVAPEDLEPYAALGVTPTSLREPRARHQEAVFALAGVLAAAARRATPPVATPGTDDPTGDVDVDADADADAARARR